MGGLIKPSSLLFVERPMHADKSYLSPLQFIHTMSRGTRSRGGIDQQLEQRETALALRESVLKGLIVQARQGAIHNTELVQSIEDEVRRMCESRRQSPPDDDETAEEAEHSESGEDDTIASHLASFRADGAAAGHQRFAP